MSYQKCPKCDGQGTVNKIMDRQEFYLKYCVIKNGDKVVKPVLSDHDKFLFNLFDKAEKEGKELVQIRGRNRTIYGFKTIEQ